VILDTTFLIDVLNGDPEAEQRRIELDERGDASVSAVSVFELAEGAHLSDRTEEELQTIVEFLSRLRIVPVDGEVALLAGELSAELIGRGERVEVEDVFVGASALHTGTAVLTRTVDDFERIPGVTVESY
jgi:predicted nucleic acid-binding protein